MKLSTLRYASKLARGLLCLAAVTVSGCIIPTPLQQAQQEPNFRPSFVPDSTTPPLESTITKAAGATGSDALVTPTVVAEDANLDDSLSVRLFRVINGSMTLTYTGFEVPLTVADTNNPVQRSGMFLEPGNWCGVFAGGMTTTTPIEMVVVVADRPFSNEAGMEFDAPGGLTSWGSWELVCR